MGDFNDFIHAILREDLNGVEELWKKEYRYGRYGGGRSSLYWASMCDNKGDIVRFLLEKGCNMEEEDDVGWRPIHVAAFCGMTVVTKILIDAGCSINAATEYGITPLEMAKGRRNYCENIIQFAKTQMDYCVDTNRLKNQPGVTPYRISTYEEIAINNVNQEVRSLGGRLINNIYFTQRTPSSDFYMLFYRKSDYINYFVNYYFSDKNLTKDHMLVSLMDDRGVVPLRALIEFPKLRQIETSVEDLIEAFQSNDVVMLANINSELGAQRRDKWCKTLVPSSSKSLQDHNISTNTELRQSPLHVTRDDGHEYLVDNMSPSVFGIPDNDVDVNTVGRLRQSPLHVGVMNWREDGSEYLVDYVKGVRAKDNMDLIQSVINDDRPTCEKIVGMMETFHKYVKIDPHLLGYLSMGLRHPPYMKITYQETIHSLCLKVNRTIYPCLLNKINEDAVNMTDGHKNTLLHLAAVSLLPDLCNQLILKSANVSSINDGGETPLLALLKENHDRYEKRNENNAKGGIRAGADIQWCGETESCMIKTVAVLMDRSSVNVEDSEGCNVLQKATEYHNEKLLLSLIRKRDHITLVRQDEWQLWLERRHLTFLKEVIPLIKRSRLKEWITFDAVKDITTDADISLVKGLYGRAMKGVKTMVVETILYKAATDDDAGLFKEMSEKDVSSNSCLPGGDSLLHCLIRERKTEYCNLLLQSRLFEYYINKKNMNNKLPLHVCIETEYWDIMDALVRETKDINEEDDEGNTPLSLLFQKIPGTVKDPTFNRLKGYIRAMITRSGDIYKVNKVQRTVISYCTNVTIRQQLEAIYKTLHSQSGTIKEDHKGAKV